ncbi:MAG: hypothetical protein ACKE5Q_00100 [Methylophilaceae bacterium]
MSDDFENMDGYNPAGKFQMGNGFDIKGKRSAVSEMNNELAVTSMRKNGAFSQVIAHGAISAIYSLWEDKYRKSIAKEINIKTNELMCDVMGDVRTLRQVIVHRNGDVDEKTLKKLNVIDWVKTGPLVFTLSDMNKLQELINTMQVYIKDGNT